MNEHKQLSYDDFIKYVTLTLSNNSYYVTRERNALGVYYDTISFTLTNKVNGLEGYYCTIDADELHHQYDNLHKDDIDDIKYALGEPYDI
jgi:uncharacterized protein YyaL (SSP411 family)